MCMYIHMCIHRCVSSWCTRRCIFSVQEHVCVYVCTYLCVCIYIWARASVCVCASTSTFAPPVHECMHACLLAYKCKYIYICIYIERERVHQTCERYSLYVYVQLCSLLRICWQAGGSQQSTETLVCLSIYPCVCPPDCMIALCSKQVPTTQPATKN